MFLNRFINQGIHPPPIPRLLSFVARQKPPNSPCTHYNIQYAAADARKKMKRRLNITWCYTKLMITVIRGCFRVCTTASVVLYNRPCFCPPPPPFSLPTSLSHRPLPLSATSPIGVAVFRVADRENPVNGQSWQEAQKNHPGNPPEQMEPFRPLPIFFLFPKMRRPHVSFVQLLIKADYSVGDKWSANQPSHSYITNGWATKPCFAVTHSFAAISITLRKLLITIY